MSGRSRTTTILAGLAMLAASAARAATDECNPEWTPASLLRGPTAIVNAPLVPFRSAAGGVRLVASGTESTVRGQVILAPMMVLGGGATGLVEMVIWLGTGLADTLTGGYFRIAPEEATHFSIEPMVPAFAPDARRPKTADPCRR